MKYFLWLTSTKVLDGAGIDHTAPGSAIGLAIDCATRPGNFCPEKVVCL